MSFVDLKDGRKAEVRKAANQTEVQGVQAMEYKFWGPDAVYPEYHPRAGQKFGDVWQGDHGLAFTQYEELWRLFSEGIDIAIDIDKGDIRGYNAFVLMAESDIRKGMPGYNFDPRTVHKPDGSRLYIINHTAPGASDAMMAFLKEYAAGRKMPIATPTWTEILKGKETHPYLVGERGDNFWLKNGFLPLEDTRDPDWRPDGGPTAVMTVRMWNPEQKESA